MTEGGGASGGIGRGGWSQWRDWQRGVEPVKGMTEGGGGYGAVGEVDESGR
ncbi:unnamed protein product [Staurois parvus]|uniref:Uncharacterized protein n=1 Tax=Staurois parvus TaxID=386267 RepID=A0ABN9CFY6_9NEOB|nr:unnamed protein product [Staurois parvus]